MAMVYVGLGTNLGDREANLSAARLGLARLRGTNLVEDAPVYETRPMGGPSGQGMYLNSVSLIDTMLEPRELLGELQALERRIGRRREDETSRWGPRVIDLDILLWDDAILDDGDPVVPHPRMAERAFVLCPLADLDPELPHPALELTVGELLQRLDLENEGIRRVSF